MYFKKLTISTAVVLLFSACSEKKTEAPKEAASETASIESRAPAQKILETLVSHDGIGMNLAYVEKQAGPAIRSEYNKHDFEIENCKLQLTTDTDNRSIQNIRVELTPECDITSKGLFQAGNIVPLNKLTFSSLAELYAPGSFSADCLLGCGNAYDPSVYFTANGSRADNSLVIVLEKPIVTDDFIDAVNIWGDAMKKEEGEDWIFNTQFNCEPNKYEDVAMKAMGHIHPQYLSFGYSITENLPKCDESVSSTQKLSIVPKPRNDCDMEYDKLLKAHGFKVKEISVHGPDEPDFNGWGCPYRIQPAPGTQLTPGSTVTYRFGFEAG